MPKVFISYRREDSAAEAGRIFDKLVSKLGEGDVFFDTNNIPFGADFRHYIKEVLAQCHVLLAIIGDDWLSVAYNDGTRKGERRLDDPDDFVRTEIEVALKNGVTVIPVLVARAKMPEESKLPATLADLAFRNAAEARSGPDFHHQVDRLVQQIEQCSLEVEPETKGKSRVFQKVWYRQKPIGVADMLLVQIKKFHEDMGLLIVRSDEIEFVGEKFRVLIKKVEKVSRGRQGMDFYHEWVKIEYKEGGDRSIALFANGQFGGVTSIVNGNDLLLESIREASGLKDA